MCILEQNSYLPGRAGKFKKLPARVKICLPRAGGQAVVCNADHPVQRQAQLKRTVAVLCIATYNSASQARFEISREIHECSVFQPQSERMSHTWVHVYVKLTKHVTDTSAHCISSLVVKFCSDASRGHWEATAVDRDYGQQSQRSERTTWPQYSAYDAIRAFIHLLQAAATRERSSVTTGRPPRLCLYADISPDHQQSSSSWQPKHRLMGT